MGAHKAPRHYGFNGLFYQKNRDTIKEDVYNVGHSFFNSNILRQYINHASVSLIPKVLQPESISELRPISCFSFIYKVIAKVVVNRLKPIMSKIITPQQSAFLMGV